MRLASVRTTAGWAAVLVAAALSGCSGSGGASVSAPGSGPPEPPAAAGGRLLGLVPAGPNFFVWVDLGRFRKWSHADALSGPLTPVLRTRLDRFRSRWSIDPYRDLDRLVYASRLSVPEPGPSGGPPSFPARPVHTVLVAQGPALKDRLLRAAPSILAGRGPLLMRASRGAPVLQAGRSALAFPDPTLAVSSDSVTVLRAVDLFRRRREEGVLDSAPLRRLWLEVAATRSGGPPAAILAADLPDALARRLARKIGLSSPVAGLAARVQVGRWFLVTVLAEFRDAAGARSAVLGVNRYVNRMAANPVFLKTGLSAYTRYLQVHQEGLRAYLQFQIPGKAFVEMVDRARKVARAVLAALRRTPR